MNKVKKQDYAVLCQIFEERAARLAEYIKRLLYEREEHIDEIILRLTKLAEIADTHEKSRRLEMLRSAEESLAAIGVSTDKLKKYFADIPEPDFDGEAFISELKKRSQRRPADAPMHKKLISDLLGANRIDEETMASYGEKYSRLRLYAADNGAFSKGQDLPAELKSLKKSRLTEDVKKLYSQYNAIAESFKDSLKGFVLSYGTSDPSAYIREASEVGEDFLRIANGGAEREYGVDVRGTAMYPWVKDCKNDFLLLSSGIRGSIVTGYPYPREAMDGILSAAFGEYSLSEINRGLPISSRGTAERFAYPIILYRDHFKVLPPTELPRKKEELSHSISGNTLTVEGDALTVAVVYMDGECPEGDPIAYASSHPEGRVGFAKRGESGKFEIPLQNGRRSLTVLAVSEDGDSVCTFEVFAGEKITVDYKVEHGRRGFTGVWAGTPPTVRFTVESSDTLDTVPSRMLPPMAVYCCESALTGAETDADAPLLSIPSLELTERDGASRMLTAEYPLYGCSAAPDTVRLEFKSPSAYFKLRCVTE